MKPVPTLKAMQTLGVLPEFDERRTYLFDRYLKRLERQRIAKIEMRKMVAALASLLAKKAMT